MIPTIGSPLPETEVTAEPDGELIVRGPQVTQGYYGLETDSIRDGVLRTGDLGVIHENGHITLKGRKKEMIVTAYGKNISIPKIEELLKSIPGVSEAVLIGEHRPYCTALLWLEGGATMARELQGRYQVTMLEAGGPFRPFSLPVRRLAGLRKTGLFLDERMIQPLLPAMKVAKTPDMVMVWGQGVGGTTTLATGNAVRCDAALKDIGIDLDAQFEALQRELPITTAHQARWTDCTRAMWTAFDRMGLNPVVTPKLLDAAKCVGCGHCAIGCPTGAKWDTRAGGSGRGRRRGAGDGMPGDGP